MSTSINNLIGTFHEAFSGKPELLDAVIAADWDDIPLGPGQEPGRAGSGPLIEGLNEAFSDFRLVVKERSSTLAAKTETRWSACAPGCTASTPASSSVSRRPVARPRSGRRLPRDRGRSDRPHPSHGGLA
jgi:hypothetical protein